MISSLYTHGTKNLNKAHKRCAPEFLILSVLKLTLCGLMDNVEHGTELDVDSAYRVCIH